MRFGSPWPCRSTFSGPPIILRNELESRTRDLDPLFETLIRFSKIVVSPREVRMCSSGARLRCTSAKKDAAADRKSQTGPPGEGGGAARKGTPQWEKMNEQHHSGTEDQRQKTRLAWWRMVGLGARWP